MTASKAGFEFQLPLDLKILEQLPLEGSLHMGAYPDGRTVEAMVPNMFGGAIKSEIVSSRLKALMIEGYVINRKGTGTGGKRIWQITTAGKEALKEQGGE